jgi:uncharacterized protein (TIGR03067 family)
MCSFKWCYAAAMETFQPEASMHISYLFGLAIIAMTSAITDPPKKDPKIDGEWAAEKLMYGGKEMDDAKGKHFVFKEGKMTAVEDKETISYKLDGGADPKRIDLDFDDTKPILGIYKLEGDVLVICFPKGGRGERPTKFESPAGSRISLMTLKRVKKD